MYRAAKGHLIPVHQPLEDVRAAIASIEHDKDTGRVTKIRFWNKVEALDKAMKHQGLYEANNAQAGGPKDIEVRAVPSPTSQENATFQEERRSQRKLYYHSLL